MEKKHVKFDLNPCIQYMVTWRFAYHQSRDGSQWLRAAIDRDRFHRRILETEKILKHVLENQIEKGEKMKRERECEINHTFEDCHKKVVLPIV
jgi:Phosphatase-1 catalytic subunit binding region